MILNDLVSTTILSFSTQILNNYINNDLTIKNNFNKNIFDKKFKLKTLSVLLALFFENKINKHFIKKNITKINKIYNDKSEIVLDVIKVSIIYLLNIKIYKFLNNENMSLKNKDVQGLFLLIFIKLLLNILMKLFNKFKSTKIILQDILKLLFNDFIIDLDLELDIKKNIVIQIINFYILKLIKKILLFKSILS